MNTNITIIFFLLSTIIIRAQFGDWKSVSPMNTPREEHASVILPNGEVLVTAGADFSGLITGSCEIYSPTNDTWRETDSMNLKRNSHNLILLNDGRVLALGGSFESSCEIFNTENEEWKMTDSMLIPRVSRPIISKMDNGNIIITGGMKYLKASGFNHLSNCEIFNTADEKWQEAGELNFNRDSHSITLLNDGRVLVTGGVGRNPNYGEMASCEIYDPAKNEWEIVDSMNTARYGHSALLLNDGRVLVAGGYNYNNPISSGLKSCEIYYPDENKWYEAGELTGPHAAHSTVQISDSTVLVVGGDWYVWEIFNFNEGNSIHDAELYPNWHYPNVIKQNSGEIMVFGGKIWDNAVVFPTSRCEIYDPLISSIEIIETDYLDHFYLFQNYPNPFNPSTTIKYEIPGPSMGGQAWKNTMQVVLKVYDILGKEIATLVHQALVPGKYEVEFNANDLVSGVYYYRLAVSPTANGAGLFVETKKMLLLR